jgi:hypothetical protein
MQETRFLTGTGFRKLKPDRFKRADYGAGAPQWEAERSIWMTGLRGTFNPYVLH